MTHAGSVIRPRREPAQSSNPPAPEVYMHPLFVRYWTSSLTLWYSAIDRNVTSPLYLSPLLSTPRLRIQPSSPPPTHPSNHLFRQPNQSPPPGSAGIMQGHGRWFSEPKNADEPTVFFRYLSDLSCKKLGNVLFRSYISASSCTLAYCHHKHCRKDALFALDCIWDTWNQLQSWWLCIIFIVFKSPKNMHVCKFSFLG